MGLRQIMFPEWAYVIKYVVSVMSLFHHGIPVTGPRENVFVMGLLPILSEH